MYPAQTSLIPVTVAIAKFYELILHKYGVFSLLFSHHWYPYWYLGVPLRYISGPIVPLFTILVHAITPGTSIFNIVTFIVVLSMILSSFGWAKLVHLTTKDKKMAILVLLITLVSPWKYFTGLVFDEGTTMLAKACLPFVLICILTYLRNGKKSWFWGSGLTVGVTLLVNSSILPSIFVGVLAIVFGEAYHEGKFSNLQYTIANILKIIFWGIVFSTLWYGPGYWLNVLANPSIGGASSFKVLIRIFELLRAVLPLITAIIAVYMWKKIQDKYVIFACIWLFTFLFLTLFRFMGNPEFWQDWISWFYELEIGLILVLSKLGQTRRKLLLFLLLPAIMSFVIYNKLNRPQLLSDNFPAGIESLGALEKIVMPGQRVFVSGSPVFWLDALHNISQVRGGRDEIATNLHWDDASYQLREDSDPEKSKNWLQAMGVQYVLVHGDASAEYYHDFKDPTKWPEVGKQVWEDNGDTIYKIDSSQAWVVDLEKLYSKKPSLETYLAARKRLVADYKWISSDKIEIESGTITAGEGIVVAVSYDSKWKAGNSGIRISKDPMGNMVLVSTIPGELKSLTLIYK